MSESRRGRMQASRILSMLGHLRQSQSSRSQCITQNRCMQGQLPGKTLCMSKPWRYMGCGPWPNMASPQSHAVCMLSQISIKVTCSQLLATGGDGWVACQTNHARSKPGIGCVLKASWRHAVGGVTKGCMLCMSAACPGGGPPYCHRHVGQTSARNVCGWRVKQINSMAQTQ